MKCTSQSTPDELKILVKFKFDYACCCVTVQSLTLGSSHKSIQCPETPVLDEGLERTWPQSERYSFGVEARPSQAKVGPVNAPQLLWRCEDFLFFPVGCFWESTLLHALSPRSRARVIYWPSKFTSKAQEVLNVKWWCWKCYILSRESAMRGSETELMKMLKISSQNQTNKSM